VTTGSSAPGYALERVAIVVNPRTCAGRAAGRWRAVREAIAHVGATCTEIETHAGNGNSARVASLIGDVQPDLVVTAGGDGTVSEVAQGMMAAATARAPSLLILPFGTANNVARSLGLLPLRQPRRNALDAAVSALREGRERTIDLGRVGDRYFVGSFALGMDADILNLRGRASRRFAASALVRGYPLYFASFAANLLLPHGAPTELDVDGTRLATNAYNLLVTNTAIYAGEFRFHEGDPTDSGSLDLHLFSGAFDYVTRYTAAWLRRLGHGWGRNVAAPRRIRKVRSLEIELAAPVHAQLDGEELGTLASCSVSVAPRALRVRVP
jgi:diacylglycerol kinase family enzyme